MTAKKNDGDVYLEILETFDGLKLNTIYERRTAYKPLYDYFQRLMIEIGSRQCGLNRGSLGDHQLLVRWDKIKYCLNYIENPKIWDRLIYRMHGIRRKVEHDDYYDPKPERLKEIRNEAIEFKDWIVRVARKYYEKSPRFTFKQSFSHISNLYLDEAEWILQKYSKKPPYVVKQDDLMDLEEYPYWQLPELVKALREKLENITSLEDIERSDLEKLIQIVEIVSDFKGKEEILLNHAICPNCGGKIKETERYFGGTEDDPEPDGLFYRVGCENCDYEFHSDTIYI